MLFFLLVLESLRGENHTGQDDIQHLRYFGKVFFCLPAWMGRSLKGPMGVATKLVDVVLVKDKLWITDVHHTVDLSISGEGTSSQRLPTRSGYMVAGLAELAA